MPPRRTDAIASELRDAILGGHYAVGQKLPAERHLAEHLGAARASVREALKQLQQLGLVATTRGGGTTVRPLGDASVEIVGHLLKRGGELDVARVEQLLDVHEMLVSGAARLAVERGSDDELLHARELVERLRAPALEPAEVATLFDDIVDLVTAASGNLVLQLCRNAIRPALAEQLHELRALLRSLDRIDEHARRIDRGLAARDPVATEEAVRALLRDRREQLIDALKHRAPRTERNRRNP